MPTLFDNQDTAPSAQQPVTVLGRTFASDEERRTYFRDELRKQLPDLKKIEGFPIGEDEDILNLSDPPYYTACPNPWINDFIAEWEAEKAGLEAQGKRVPEFVVDEPYASDVSEGKNNPVYSAHTYHTKVPHPAIMRYIMHYTQPGDIVFDGFAGTGMTGVAAQACENPDSEVKKRIEKEWQESNLIRPNWGRRHAICGDLSPYASMISYNYNTPLDRISFSIEANRILSEVINECSWLYETKHTNGEKARINYTVWSDVYNCNECGKEIVYWDAALDRENKNIREEFCCPNCGAAHNKNKTQRVFKTIFDKRLNKSIKIAESVPVLIAYTFSGKRFEKVADDFDLELLTKIDLTKTNYWHPINDLPFGYNTEQPIRSHGVSNVHLFYTIRNLFALAFLFDKIDSSPMSNKLKFLFTGMINRSTKMNRIHVNNYFFGGGGWNAGHLKGTLYIPSLPIETSILEQIEDKISSYLKASFHLPTIFDNMLYVGTANRTTIASNTVDYLFVDPPFGANIMYSELNFLAESWLKVITNNLNEAIENKSQGKGYTHYLNTMTSCFKEFFRVLKPNKWMTVEFSNTSAAVWNAIQNSIISSGFIIANVAALDKKQGGMRSITTTTAVRQDLAISCYKPSIEFDTKFRQSQYNEVGIWDFVAEHLHHLPIHLVKEHSTTAIIERSPKILFDRLIAFYVQRSLPVPIDAGLFQKGLRERFIERDGMFFTSDQVHEYDSKRAEMRDFTELSLFVSSEQDGVMWLKHELQHGAQTYQELQPKWMQALASVRKGDILPELRSILEENFLRNEAGAWYQPDLENEIDLEKVRTKRLLKQFDGYKEQALKPKTKIKEARVEALRIGFKQCYKEKDFKTIVTVGDSIPNNLLMEDEVLLQYYDIAVTRV